MDGILDLTLYFFIYGFLGWLMETLIFSFKEKKFVNRGFLNGPICPIYGFGMVIILLFLSPLEENVYLIFFVGGFLSTTLEFIAGWLLESIFHTRWWDYSRRRYNVEGYICLTNTIYWAILSVIMMRIVHPQIRRFVTQLTLNLKVSTVILLLIVLSFDFLTTIFALFKMKNELAKVAVLKNKLAGELKASEWYHHLEELNDIFKAQRTKMETSLSHRIEDLALTRKQLYKKANFIQKRLLQAFPNLTTIDRQDKKTEKKGD